MPIVSIEQEWLNRLLGRDYTPEQLADSLEQLGCDVDDIVEMARSRCPRCSAPIDFPAGQEEISTCPVCGYEGGEPFPEASRHTVLRLDLLAARPDLFDIAGIARALKGTLGIETGMPRYALEPGALTVRVDPSTAQVRPYIACAVLRDLPLDESLLTAIFKLQENLHWGVGRDRKLASIGVYDLDTLAGEITYTTLDPDSEPFVPLGYAFSRLTGREILAGHPKGVHYAHLLAHLKRYPVLRDARGQVLSMPPIINSEETRVTLKSRNYFVDVTGLAEAAVVKSLDTLVCAMADFGARAESVTVVYPDRTVVTPDLRPRAIAIRRSDAERWVGVSISGGVLVESLGRMRLNAAPDPADAGGDAYTVSYAPYRTDFRHPVDVYEDVAVGYGYQNIAPAQTRAQTFGEARREESLSETVRQVLTGLGFTENMSLPLTTEDAHFRRLRLEPPAAYPCVSNPKLKTYNVVRTHLFTGLMEALYENRRRPMPVRLFEIDDIVALDAEAETGARQFRAVAFAEIGPEAGYAAGRSVLDAILRELGWTAQYEPLEDARFVPGRAARCRAGDEREAVLGELHPEAIVNCGLSHPVCLGQLILARVI